MLIPAWALQLSFWLHMLATVVWIGALAALALLVLPSVRRALKPAEFAKWLSNLNQRLDPLGWFSLGLLTFTGLIQMEANPNYVGLFNLANPWAQAICMKHIVFLGMIGVSAYLTWIVAPALRRTALKGSGSQLTKIVSRFQNLVVLNLILGILVLAFTALARTS